MGLEDALSELLAAKGVPLDTYKELLAKLRDGGAPSLGLTQVQPSRAPFGPS